MTSRRDAIRTLACLPVAFASGRAALGQTQPRYPGATWDHIPLAQSGWSGEQLARAQAFSRKIGSTAVVVVQHGAMVASWGDTKADLLLNSARKSLLSALIGIAAGKGRIHLDATLQQLGIDDNPPSLTQTEKQATVRDLLEARSGVYHPANYETPEMAAMRPARGSHPPGTFWYYNNWDFNTLGAIYERATGRSVFSAFEREIAAPIGMQDFHPRNCRYFRGPASIYPAYLFFASARDLARFGLLYLRHGVWDGKQIIPAGWVRESTRSYSMANKRAGYGYLWWTELPGGPLPRLGIPRGTYWAVGNGGQMVFVIPAYDMVVVHLARTHLARADERGVPTSRVIKLLSLVLTARP